MLYKKSYAKKLPSPTFSPPMTWDVRSTATITFLVTMVTTILFAFDFIVMALFLSLLQTFAFLGAIIKPKKHIYRFPARLIREWFPIGEPEHPLPLKFAAQIGFVIMVLATSAGSLSSPKTAMIFAATCAVAAGLNAFANLCIACLLYPRMQIILGKFGGFARVLKNRDLL